MKLKSFAEKSRFTCLVLFTGALVGLAAQSSYAQAKKAAPSGWRIHYWATDQFNDRALGWQWGTQNMAENSKRKNGSNTKTRFRSANVVMDGSVAIIKNEYHNSPISEGGTTFQHSGGWLQSKANWLTEGLFQFRSKVDWNHDDIWPTGWLWCNGLASPNCGNGGFDELDIFEYQSNILNQTHHLHKVGGGSASAKRVWAVWNVPKWEHNWALAQVRSWTHWAVMTTRSSPATFYINGKKENTSTGLRNVVSPMNFLFTSSPHNRHLPDSGPLPAFRIDWLETHIP